MKADVTHVASATYVRTGSLELLEAIPGGITAVLFCEIVDLILAVMRCPRAYIVVRAMGDEHWSQAHGVRLASENQVRAFPPKLGRRVARHYYFNKAV
jgi:hypothetical protein